MNTFTGVESLAFAFGPPSVSGTIRKNQEDFEVCEHLSFPLTGAGEHVYLHIEKRGCNTVWLAKQIAKLAGVRNHDVGYAGLKDRHAITRQWFSVYLPAVAEPDWEQLRTEFVTVLEHTRHQAKLRKGAIRHNSFKLVVRDLSGDTGTIPERLSSIEAYGVPNYFTEQRFGHNNNNLQQALALFQRRLKIRDRQKKGIFFSAARSWLFNLILSERVKQHNWNRFIPGDIMMLNGSEKFFSTSEKDDAGLLQQRINEHDIHPTAVLCGKDGLTTCAQAYEIENAVINRYPDFRDGLIRAGIKQGRRRLCLLPENLQWEFVNDDTLLLSFDLQRGSYATAVLRELVNYTQANLAK